MAYRQEVTQTGAGSTAWIPVDWRASPFSLSLVADITGTVSSTIEYTVDNVLAGATATAMPVSSMSAITADTAGNIAFPVTAVRITQASGAGSTRLIITQSPGT